MSENKTKPNKPDANRRPPKRPADKSGSFKTGASQRGAFKKDGFKTDSGKKGSGRNESRQTSNRRPKTPQATMQSSPGFEARKLSISMIHDVMVRRRSFDASLNAAFQSPMGQGLEPRDRALARLIAVSVLRRHGELAAVLNTFLGKPLSEDKGKVWPILLAGAAQLLLLEVQPHAAISLSVDLARADPSSERFAKLVNAILRRVSETGAEILAASSGAERNITGWLLESWQSAYGEEAAKQIANASLTEPALDISVQQNADRWAEALGGTVLATGSVRARTSGRIENLAGFEDGQWWVQDAAAALPVRLFGNVEGKRVADLCAAPGGKTLQLAAAGADVTAVDSSLTRLKLLEQNLARTNLKATPVAADVATWMPDGRFDCVLLDGPCTATGTIRRHPDIVHLKRESDIAALAKIQADLLRRAADIVAPGGTLIYCTCSLQPEEGEGQIARFLEKRPEFRRQPIAAGEAGILPTWLTPDGDLRTLPHLGPSDSPELSGIDGFYAARLVHQPQT